MILVVASRTSSLTILILSLWLSACAGVATPPVSAPATNDKPSAVQLTTNDTKEPADASAPAIRIKAVGDVMLGTDYPEDWLPPAGVDLLADVAAILRDADITFGNYEGTLLNGGEPAKQCKNPKRCYVFRTPPDFVRYLLGAGFDVMSLANNHARDFGDEGRESTMQVLQTAGIRHSGVTGDIAQWTVQGRRIILVAFAPFRGANNPLAIHAAAHWIEQLSEQADIILISMHMGAEGEGATHLPFKTEMFHGEDRGDSVAFAHAMIEAGADLVIGHGPHVPRALELYEGRLIAYSLGNFCTYFGINVRGKTGLAPILDVTLAADGRFVRGRILSMRQQRPAGPRPDASAEAARLMAELTAADFPESLIRITAEGEIQPKPFEPPLKDWVQQGATLP